MKNRSGKHRAASEKAFVGAHSSGFGAFSSASRRGTLSYLSEPPDFSSISDPNVIISFKNLLKKDATTKAKALEDLVAYVEAHPYEQAGGTEEPILEAWAQLYPRISIDNSRRVRELSHTLQCELLKSARKRMERYIPKIVASWLAGTFDRDRGVARVAAEGLASTLSTPEKVAQFWRRCQQQILEYASEAIRETADTLSDERSTSLDDAEAKYYRVIGGSLALVLNLLQKLNASDIEKHRDDYDNFFGEDKVWSSAVSSDATVRRLSCQLVLACLERRADIIEGDLSRFSKVFVGEGLKSNQTGSASDYIRTLIALTSRFPTIWTSNYMGKKSPSSRLRTFLEKGSQGSTATFWELLNRLVVILPEEVLPSDLEGSLELMSALRLGATGRGEPRSNAIYAWSCYLNVAGQLLKAVEPAQSQVKFAQETVFPLTEQYLSPAPERSSWSSGSQVPVLIKAYMVTASKATVELSEATKQEWIRHKEALKSRMRASLPEASKDHERSQKSIADEGTRWFTLAGKLLELAGSTISAEYPVPDLLTEVSLELLTEGLQLLQIRNWKPFGISATFESALRNCPALFGAPVGGASSLLDSMNAAILDSRETFLVSPSALYILSSVMLLGAIAGREQDFEHLWRTSVDIALSFPQSPGAVPALEKLISSKHAAALACRDQQLQAELIRRCVIYAANDDDSEWPIFHSAINFEALSEDSANELTGKLVGLLTQHKAGEVPHGTVKALMFIAQQRPQILTRDQVIHTSILTSLLSLSEQSEDPNLTTLRVLLDHPAAGKFNMVEIIHKNIHEVEPESLGIDTLVDQAARIRETVEETGGSAFDLEALLPDPVLWRRELSTLLSTSPNPSLSITSGLGGSYFLVAPESHTSKRHVKWDRDGCSIAARMARYTSALLSQGFDIGSIPRSKRVDLVICLSVTAEIAADQATVMDSDQLWKTLALGNSVSDAQSLISASRRTLAALTRNAAGWRDGSGSEESGFMHDMIHQLLSEAASLTPLGIYSARVMSELLETLTERHGLPSSAEAWLSKLDVMKSTPSTILPAVAILTGLGDNLSVSKSVSNLCNRLVSDVAGAKIELETSLATLVMLNACMRVYEVGELPVANNRLVFAVRQITAWLEDPSSIDYRFAAEICRSLQYLLPCIKDVYGSYWERAVDFCSYLWSKDTSEPLDSRLSYIHASLKLLNSLQTIRDPNDDLVDVLQSTAEARSVALIELLKLPREKPSQPLDIVDAIICRQVESLPLEHVKDISDLYSLVASESKTIQTAAFTVLHRALPAAQEQISVDVLLDKKNAQLPDELLSLLLDPPTLEAYSDEALSHFPIPIRCYLLSWLLVFDAFEGAAHKVRSDYAENLKTDNYIGPLMDFTFDVLGHSAAHVIDLDKANFNTQHIHDYSLRLADAETDERNMQWLLIHLFYLVLKYVPLLFKSWYLDCRSKQTKIAVESWMAKYFSPLIISEALDEVETWGKTQEPPAEDEKELIVTVSKPAREITAGYEVDELYASIDIRIPQAYPLENVEVVSKQRVGVNEKKWQSWILTTKGVITFSGGSIVDGLTAFRRNMVGAMKGQTECAICYSIVSTDKRMPDKQCQTCRNLFHRTCLYKWFQTSNQNTCPLCRNPIDYLGVDTRGRRTA